MRWAGLAVDDSGIATHYAGLIDGLLADSGTASGAATLSGVVMRRAKTIMPDAARRERVAREALDFAEALSV